MECRSEVAKAQSSAGAMALVTVRTSGLALVQSLAEATALATERTSAAV